MKTVKVYTPAELKKKSLGGFERAHEWFNQGNDDIPWQGEIMDSFKAIFKASGISIKDWSIDGNYPSSSSVSFEMESDTMDLSGQRALAWLENNLFEGLRIKYTPYGRVDKEHQFKSERAIMSKYGSSYYAGKIKPCPFTGYCADEDFIESLLNDIKAGDTLGEAYNNLARVAGKLFEQEIEYQNSEENFLEQEIYFTIDGDYVR